jgi:hypothetical protein
VSEYIDIDSFVFVQNLSSPALHALLVYEKGFDTLGIRERIGDPFSLIFRFIRKVCQTDCPQRVIGSLGSLNPVSNCLDD